MANNEWATPLNYLHSARIVMGSIDLDPASNHSAQENVKAETYYTQEMDGLQHHWQGKTWINPPFGRGLAKPFMEKLIKHYVAGDVLEAIVLTNNVTDTAWFADTLGTHAAMFCFPSPRIQFITPPGTKKSSNSHGQVFSYFGRWPAKFVEEFGQYGIIAAPIRKIT